MRRRKSVPEVAKAIGIESVKPIKKGPTMNSAYLAHCWKSILAFLSLLATNVATLWVVQHQPLPQNGGQWATFAVTTIGGTWLVWQKGNAPKPTS